MSEISLGAHDPGSLTLVQDHHKILEIKVAFLFGKSVLATSNYSCIRRQIIMIIGDILYRKASERHLFFFICITHDCQYKHLKWFDILIQTNRGIANESYLQARWSKPSNVALLHGLYGFSSVSFFFLHRICLSICFDKEHYVC